MSLRRFPGGSSPNHDPDERGVLIDAWKSQSNEEDPMQDESTVGGGAARQRDPSISGIPDRFRRSEDRQAPSDGRRPETPPTAAQPLPESVIDRHSTFDGKFQTAQDLRIEGTISGEITCEGILHVAREAVAKVKVHAREIHVHGRLEGELDCAEKLVLAETAYVTGSVKTTLLEMHEGAVLNGSVEMGKSDGESSGTRRRSRRNSTEEEEPEPSLSLNSASE